MVQRVRVSGPAAHTQQLSHRSCRQATRLPAFPTWSPFRTPGGRHGQLQARLEHRQGPGAPLQESNRLPDAYDGRQSNLSAWFLDTGPQRLRNHCACLWDHRDYLLGGSGWRAVVQGVVLEGGYPGGGRPVGLRFADEKPSLQLSKLLHLKLHQ